MSELNFSNWGLCLDTGHLMNLLGNCREEREGIDRVLRVIGKYPRDMMDKIDLVHLHMSLSGDYQDECIRHPKGFTASDDSGMISEAYEHACRIDQHRPFTDVLCTEIVRILGPKYVTHEISAPSAPERLSGFSEQRSLFRDRPF
jgi:hypothetical protein